MELTVRTLRGSALLDAVADDITLDSLKARLHEAFAASLNVPVPERQSVVFAGRRLEHGSVKAAGVGAGATLVVLETAPLLSAAPHASVPAPTASEIRSAIVEEARRRGIEDQLVHDTPSLPRAPLTAPHDLMDMDNQLMGLIEALEGRLGQLRNAGGSGAASGGSGGDAVADAATLTGAGATPAAPAATGLAEPEDLEQMITPPEPEAELLSQLTDMGFSNALARKALMLHRNRVPEAVEWVLVHAEDADAEEPVTQEQLRRIYGPARRRGGGAPVGGDGAGGDPPGAAVGAVATALRELRMSLLQAVGVDAEGMEGLLDPSSALGMLPGQVPSLGLAVGGGGGGGDAVDPLAAFRRRLAAQLGEGGGAEPSDAVSLSDLFSLEALSGLRPPGDGDADDGSDEHEHGEEEDDDEEGGNSGHGNVAPLHF